MIKLKITCPLCYNQNRRVSCRGDEDGNYFSFRNIFSNIYTFIMCVILSAIIICLIRTKVISKTFKILIIITILLCVCIILTNIKSERPNNLYIEMKEMNDNQSLIGLSKEELLNY